MVAYGLTDAGISSTMVCKVAFALKEDEMNILGFDIDTFYLHRPCRRHATSPSARN